MKFLQIHHFYEPYLEHFYSLRPQLAEAPFELQSSEIIADGFSGPHMFAPHLSDLGYEATLLVSNCEHAQHKWAEENGRSDLITSPDWTYEILRAQIATIKPDVLYISHPIEFDSKFIRSLSYRPKFIFGWRSAEVPEGSDFSEFQLMLTGETVTRDNLLQHGAQAVELFRPCFPRFLTHRVKHVNKEDDLVFSGQWSPAHTARNSYLTHIAEQVSSGNKSILLAYYIFSHEELPPAVASFDRGARWGIEMYSSIKKGKIAFNSLIDFGREVTTNNMRLYEITGIGSFLLTEYHPSLKELFEPGTEVETFKDNNELIEKIDYYLTHENEREEIAKRGHERCMRDHSMQVRAAELDQIIKRNIGGAEELSQVSTAASLVEPVSTEPSQLENRINKLINDALSVIENDPRKALSYTSQAKTYRRPVRDLDYVRAICFLKLGQLGEAREALLEELRHFSDNTVASELLDQVRAEEQSNTTQIVEIQDFEFKNILSEIRPYSMLLDTRLYSLFKLAKDVCEKDIAGNFVECGVAGGGSSAMLAWVIKNYSKRPRLIYSFDTYEGMPEPTDEDQTYGVSAMDTGWATGTCAAPTSSLLEIANKLSTSHLVVPVKGLFQETLPRLKTQVGQIAFIHMDSDWYESTKSIFENFYENVAPGGVVQLDDYGQWDGVEQAVSEYQAQHKLDFAINNIDGGSAWFIKP